MNLRKWTCSNCGSVNTSDLDVLRVADEALYRDLDQVSANRQDFLVKCIFCHHQTVIVVEENEQKRDH
jgi:hypothetical protein